MNLDEEVRLYTTSAERERTENLATLYSIILSLEYLERAYVRDSVTGKEWVAISMSNACPAFPGIPPAQAGKRLSDAAHMQIRASMYQAAGAV